jgi:hypothetical protein
MVVSGTLQVNGKINNVTAAPGFIVPDSIGPKCALLSTPPPATTKSLTFRQVNSSGCVTQYVTRFDSLLSFTEGHETCHMLLGKYYLDTHKSQYDLPAHVQYRMSTLEALLDHDPLSISNAQMEGIDTLSQRLDANSGTDKGPLSFAGVLASQSNNWTVITLNSILQYRRLPTLTSVCP